MYREWKNIVFPKKVSYMNLETRLRGRPRNRWQDEVREDVRLFSGKGWKENNIQYKKGIEEDPENDKELHSACANGKSE
jgi:hypothetical protein